ncbi:MAG: hypothetical protein HQL59_05695 [Magnetococcales bacterium]|nr:hypothetical protein [Magnetococcales bacterium]
MLRSPVRPGTVLGFFVLLLFVGYWGLFIGHDFMVEEDPVTVQEWLHPDLPSHGWRSDHFLGSTSFFGDPAAYHAWSLLGFWERMIPGQSWPYSLSILLLSLAAGIAQYAFLRRLAPNHTWLALFLAPLVIFSPMQHELYFQRTWISLCFMSPLTAILLHDYLLNPRTILVFLYTLVLFSGLFLGSVVMVQQAVSVNILFFTVFLSYKKNNYAVYVKRFFSINAYAALSLAFLGAWVGYSLWTELRQTGYERDIVRDLGRLDSGTLTLGRLVSFVFGLLHSGWYDNQVGVLQLKGNSWYNVSPLFPVAFVFIAFYKTRTFWEYLVKWMFFSLFVYQVVVDLFPGLLVSVLNVFNFYPMSKMFTNLYMFQSAIVLIMIHRFFEGSGTVFPTLLAGRIGRGLSFILFAGYATLLFLVLLAWLFPGWLPALVREMIGRYGPESYATYPREILAILMGLNVERLQSSFGWALFGFYLFAALTAFCFLHQGVGRMVVAGGGVGLSGLFLVTSLFLSWGVYPLNAKLGIWEPESREEAEFQRSLRPYDRFYRTHKEAVPVELKDSEYYRRVTLPWFAAWERRTGYRNPPGLAMGSIQNFSPQAQIRFLRALSTTDSGPQFREVRDLENGPPISSPLLDLAAVSYYYSDRPLIDGKYRLPEFLEFVFEKKGLSVYRNKNAWPYFYLADSLEPVAQMEELISARPGVAYLRPEELSLVRPVEPGVAKGEVEIEQFENGRIVFSYAGQRNEFLVVADGWHPFWKADLDGAPLRVMVANGVFKGIELPPGRGRVTLFFDTSPYWPGVYISLLSWVFFLLLFARYGWEGAKAGLRSSPKKEMRDE